MKSDDIISNIIYFDENNNIVEDKALAVRTVIRECDKNGKLIREIFGEINNKDDEDDE